jgi:hypothetical protein
MLVVDSPSSAATALNRPSLAVSLTGISLQSEPASSVPESQLHSAGSSVPEPQFYSAASSVPEPQFHSAASSVPLKARFSREGTHLFIGDDGGDDEEQSGISPAAPRPKTAAAPTITSVSSLASSFLWVISLLLLLLMQWRYRLHFCAGTIFAAT